MTNDQRARGVMLRALIVAAAFLAGPVHAQVFKCQQGGAVVYSDQPCAGRAEVLDTGRLRANTLRRDPDHHLNEVARPAAAQPMTGPQAAAPVATAAPARAAPSPNCPSELDIRNMEVSLGSMTYDNRRKEREFLQAEIRRARACSKEGGNYTPDEWKRLKEEQAAQGNLRPQDRERARATAKGIHASSASEAEQQRMQADELNDAIRDAGRRAAKPLVLTNCDPAGCWDTQGRRYNNAAGGFARSDGVFCTRTGPHVRCP